MFAPLDGGAGLVRDPDETDAGGQLPRPSSAAAPTDLAVRRIPATPA